MRRQVLLVALAGALTGSGLQAANAQAPGEVEALLACRQIQDDAARAACMDTRLDSFAAALEEGRLAVVERERIRSVEQDSFGLNIPNLSGLTTLFAGRSEGDNTVADLPDGGAAVYDRSGQLSEIRDIPVRNLSTNAAGDLVVELANGQSWLQIDDTYVSVDQSDLDTLTASLRRGFMGSYFLKLNESGRSFRARRIDHAR